MLRLLAALLLFAFGPFHYAYAQETTDQDKIKQQALAAQAAIRNGNYAEADRIFDHAIDTGTFNNWDYSFEDFEWATEFASDPKNLPVLNKWVKADGSAFAYMLRARYYYNLAWTVRGHDFAQQVPPASLQKYDEYMRQAVADLIQSIKLNRKVAYLRYMLLSMIGEIGNQAAIDDVFRNAIVAFPDYYSLYQERLRLLAPKWGGSVEEMIAFTNKYTAGISENSPLKLLYLDLYYLLVDDVKINCLESKNKETCQKAADELLEGRKMEENINKVLALYDGIGHYEFSKILIKKILHRNRIRSTYTRTFLEFARKTLPRDAYVVNYLFAMHYSWQEQYLDAAKFLRLTLQDIETFRFPSTKEKNEMLSSVYDELSDVSGRLKQPIPALLYASKAIETNEQNGLSYQRRCSAQIGLGHNIDATKDCMRAIELKQDNSLVWYMLGNAYLGLKNIPKAEQAYEAGIQAKDDLYSGNIRAQIMGVASAAYAGNGETRKAIALYEKYFQVLNESQRLHAYAVLCGQYMGLGDFDSALKQCDKASAIGFDPLVPLYREEIARRKSYPPVPVKVPLMRTHTE